MYKTAARFKSQLNDISLGVHRKGKLLTTDLKVIRFSSMRSNVCDKDSGTICCGTSTVIVFTCYQGKAQEGQFDDFPMGYRDIPGTNPVCFIHVGEIEAGNVTTRSINIFSRRGTGWKREDFYSLFCLSLKKKQLQWKRVSMGWWLPRLTIKISQFLCLTVNFFWPFFETFVNQKCYICFLSKKGDSNSEWSWWAAKVCLSFKNIEV